jgi:hypothetical protein
MQGKNEKNENQPVLLKDDACPVNTEPTEPH